MVSVIIPTHNRPHLLKRAIISALYQQDVDLEILVINDFVDELPVINLIKELDDNRIRYFRNERTKGGNGARNTGIIHARGEFLAFLDDDDEWYATKLRYQTKFLSNSDELFGGVYCGYRLQVGGNWVSIGAKKSGKLQYELLTGKYTIGASSTLVIRKNIVTRIGLFDEELKRNQDNEFLVRFFQYYNIGYVDKILLNVYGHNLPKDELVYETAKLLFLCKIQSAISILPIQAKSEILAFQYRELALAHGMYGNNKKLVNYTYISLSYKVLNPLQYLSLILYLLKNTTGIDLTHSRDKIKYLFSKYSLKRTNKAS